MLLSIILFFVGLLGGVLPLFFNRDGSSLIIIGFGGGLLLLHNMITEKNKNPVKAGSVIALTLAVFIAGTASMIYNALKFVTNYNKVLSVGFIVLLIWEAVIIIAALIKTKK